MTTFEAHTRAFAQVALEEAGYCICPSQVLYLHKLMEPTVAAAYSCLDDLQNAHEFDMLAKVLATLAINLVASNSHRFHRPGASATAEREEDRGLLGTGEHC
jgi:hypothetical protein